jgi:hypothetical protein
MVMTTSESVEEVITGLKTACRNCVESGDEWMPMAVIIGPLGPDGKRYEKPCKAIIPLGDLIEDRTATLKTLRHIVVKMHASVCMIATECYALIHQEPKAEKLTPLEIAERHEAIMRDIKEAGGVSNHPDRQEALTVVVVGPAREEAWYAVVTREGEKVTVGEWDHSTEMAGIWTRLFPPAASA